MNWRGFIFGWVCTLRGYHQSRDVWPVAEKGAGTIAVRFRCICGDVAKRTADVKRGGRVLTPFTWRLEDRWRDR